MALQIALQPNLRNVSDSRFYRAETRAGRLRSRSKHWLALQFLGAVIIALLDAPTGAAQDLGPILYSSWTGLCSVSPMPGSKPRCLRGYDGGSWQPNGNRILAYGRDGLAFLTAKGKLIEKIGGGNPYRATWSPGGHYLYAVNYKLGRAVERWDADGKNRVVMPVKGLENRQLSPPGQPYPNSFQMISLSPSGKWAALLTMGFNHMLIVEVGDKSMTALKVLPRGFSYVAQSAWLDEDHLLFVGERGSGRQELWELDIRSGKVTRRGIDGLWLRDFVALSPNRKSVVVTAMGKRKNGSLTDSWNLWLYSLETSRAVRLTTEPDGEDVDPSWRH